MSSIVTKAPARRASISAVITRADGTVENLGRIAFYHRNPIINWFGNLFVRR